MTCEIAVANRLGIALAADSAMTFTKGSANGTMTSYSSGANKILQPLRNEPVGLMVYNNSTFGDLPWELIIKQFREQDGEKPEEEVAAYMRRIVSYMESARLLFPDEVRRSHTHRLFGVALIRLISTLRQNNPDVDDGSVPVEQRRIKCADFVSAFEVDLDGQNAAAQLSEEDLQTALSTDAINLVGEAVAAVQQSAPELVDVLPVADLLRLAVKITFRRPSEVFNPSSHTGIVVAGYGTLEVLPGFVEREFYGFVGNRIYSVERASKSVPRGGVGALIEAFARRSMVETFTQGISPEAWGQAEREFRAHARLLVNRTAAQSGGATLSEETTEALVQEAKQGFMTQWAHASINAHWHPLLEVVAGLAMDQLAELGENLVMLESLKERVTHRTQSVGGPIDVAIITKAEGLVWIKRKHYFPRELNHRYFGRLTAWGVHGD